MPFSHHLTQQGLAKTGEIVQQAKLETVQKQMAIFKEKLEEFARKHRKEINDVPEFRAKFHQMCQSIGADPLASNKGFWSELLGIGTFYSDLGVQIVDVCYTCGEVTGGLMDMADVLRRLAALRGDAAQKVVEDDVRRAIAKLGVLGSGFRVLELAGEPGRPPRLVVQSVPTELSTDHNAVLEACGTKHHTTITELAAGTGWPEPRCRIALDELLALGMAWIDTADDTACYWIPALTGLTS